MNGFLLALLFLGAAAPQDSFTVKEPCLRYEPIVVRLSGTVSLRTFPGPPNYESISGGDRPEKQALLELTLPICVLGDSTSDLNQEGETDQREVTLVPGKGMNLTQYDRVSVSVAGELFHAQTGHHRTPLLLTVESITPARQKGPSR